MMTNIKAALLCAAVSQFGCRSDVLPGEDGGAVDLASITDLAVAPTDGPADAGRGEKT